MADAQDTSVDALQSVRESGEDVSLRRRVAAVLGGNPMTVTELAEALPEASRNSIRPRVNELVRMECVERRDKRTNPSGHEAYVHHLTDLGREYVHGRADPEPEPPVAELRQRVVDVARAVARGDAGEEMLEVALDRHDRQKKRMDPDWDGDH